MGYLRQYEHDIFVSYAHAEALNDWSKRLVDEARKLVAAGLGLQAGERRRSLDGLQDLRQRAADATSFGTRWRSRGCCSS